jgi:hypothetical protein
MTDGLITGAQISAWQQERKQRLQRDESRISKIIYEAFTPVIEKIESIITDANDKGE